ncbi:hypothetical protein G9A89_021695, partial [Geosiphon pyriformis]
TKENLTPYLEERFLHTWNDLTLVKKMLGLYLHCLAMQNCMIKSGPQVNCQSTAQGLAQCYASQLTADMTILRNAGLMVGTRVLPKILKYIRMPINCSRSSTMLCLSADVTVFSMRVYGGHNGPTKEPSVLPYIGRNADQQSQANEVGGHNGNCTNGSNVPTGVNVMQIATINATPLQSTGSRLSLVHILSQM